MLAILAGTMLLSNADRAAAAEIAFQADRDNTPVSGGHANSNFGTAPDFSVGRVNAGSPLQRATVGFDVSGLDGLFTSIDSITLRLTHNGDVVSSSTLTNEVYAISAANQGWNPLARARRMNSMSSACFLA